VKLENSFDVEARPEAAWELLMDVPRVIPCMPGAKLLDTVDEANWKAQLDVKLGPIGLAFATDVKREAADEAARVATLSARARETRGRGGAQAKIESRLTPTDGGTHVDIVTDLSLSGPVAQYGRGLIEDVSRQLVGRFADCLRTQLTAATPEEAEAATAVHAKPVAGVRLGLGALASSVARRFRRPRPAA
jgi:uncharacterized protein